MLIIDHTQTDGRMHWAGDPWPGYCRKMEHAIEHFYHELSGVRTGRASPTLLDSVMVDSHGERTNLSHVATVVLKSTHMLSITVYDKAIAPGVLAAIRKSPLQLQPREEGGEVLVPVPQCVSFHRPQPIDVQWHSSCTVDTSFV